MHVRVARFEGIDTSNIDRDMEEFRKMVRMAERPEGMPEETYSTLKNGVKRMMSLVDRALSAAERLGLPRRESASTARSPRTRTTHAACTRRWTACRRPMAPAGVRACRPSS